jgi:hypothetical protein
MSNSKLYLVEKNLYFEDIRKIRKLQNLKKIKRSTLCRDLGVKLEGGSYYEINNPNQIFWKITLEQNRVPGLTKRILETIRIPAGKYEIADPSKITSVFDYKHVLIKNELRLTEDIVIRKGKKVGIKDLLVFDLFNIKPVLKLLLLKYLVRDNTIVSITPIKEAIFSSINIFLKEISLNNKIYHMDLEKLKILFKVLSSKVKEDELNKVLSNDDNKDFMKQVEALSYEELFHLYQTYVPKVEKKVEEVKEEKKVEEVKEEKKVEEENFDFF